MGPLRDEDIVELRDMLEGMANPVRLVHFTQELNVEHGREAQELLKQLAGVSDKLSLEIYNFLLDKEKVSEYGVERVPATVIRNEKDYGLRYFGMPAGYEFSALLDAILAVSKGDSGLKEDTRQKLRELSKPLHLQVFVTPT